MDPNLIQNSQKYPFLLQCFINIGFFKINVIINLFKYFFVTMKCVPQTQIVEKHYAILSTGWFFVSATHETSNISRTYWPKCLKFQPLIHEGWHEFVSKFQKIK